MTLSPRTIARSILRWDWLSCVSSAARRTRFMWGSNPSRIPRYPRPPFSSTITFELIRWLRRESGLIIGPRPTHGGDLLKGCRVPRANARHSGSHHGFRSPEGFWAVSFGSCWRRAGRADRLVGCGGLATSLNEPEEQIFDRERFSHAGKKERAVGYGEPGEGLAEIRIGLQPDS